MYAVVVAVFATRAPRAKTDDESLYVLLPEYLDASLCCVEISCAVNTEFFATSLFLSRHIYTIATWPQLKIRVAMRDDEVTVTTILYNYSACVLDRPSLRDVLPAIGLDRWVPATFPLPVVSAAFRLSSSISVFFQQVFLAFLNLPLPGFSLVYHCWYGGASESL